MPHRRRPVVPHQHQRNAQPIQAYPSVVPPARTVAGPASIPRKPVPYNLTGHHAGTILTVNNVRHRPQASIVPTVIPTRVATVVPNRSVVYDPLAQGHGGHHHRGHVHHH